jgi:esterase/lipase superfamily enzyme
VIKEISQLSAKDFFEALTTKVGSSPERDALIFFHGFNVSFTESVIRTAQIAADIGFNGAPIVYSWPSRKSIFRYMADEATATGYSIDNIIQLIKDVRTNTGAERVHLIAHSMGNRFLTEALKSLNEQGFTKDFLFNQIILAAPDIDAEVFVKHLAPKIVKTGKQVTLYTSVHDKALGFSEWIHGDNQRAGGKGDHVAIFEGIDTVDASSEKTDFLGHGYFSESKALVDDIFRSTRFEHTPAERNLRKRVSGQRFYWDF